MLTCSPSRAAVRVELWWTEGGEAALVPVCVRVIWRAHHHPDPTERQRTTRILLPRINRNHRIVPAGFRGQYHARGSVTPGHFPPNVPAGLTVNRGFRLIL